MPWEKFGILKQTSTPCVLCNSNEAIFVFTKTEADFDISSLGPELGRRFLKKRNAYCVKCGLFQDFRNFTDEEILIINRLGKDELTNDPTYAHYPPPNSTVEAFNRNYYGKRFLKWAYYLDQRSIKNALFLRYFWGAAPEFIANRYGANVYGVDMSTSCSRYVSERMPNFNVLEGEINGKLTGPFLESGPYDLVVIFHVMSHSFEIRNSIEQIRKLVQPGGAAIFMHDSVRKPKNPFHRIHAGEIHFVNLIKTSFSSVLRIDDCEDVIHDSINPYSIKGDVPDFIAF